MIIKETEALIFAIEVASLATMTLVLPEKASKPLKVRKHLADSTASLGLSIFSVRNGQALSFSFSHGQILFSTGPKLFSSTCPTQMGSVALQFHLVQSAVVCHGSVLMVGLNQPKP